MNAYEVKAGMVFFAGQKLCDPCLSTLEWFVPCKVLYKCSDFFFSFTLAASQFLNITLLAVHFTSTTNVAVL